MKWFNWLGNKKQQRASAAQFLFSNSATSASGKIITATTAINIPVVWDCVRVLAETLATLPVFVYRKLGNGGKERVKDHPINRLLHLKPNSYQTSVTFFEQLQAACALKGNAYVQKVFDQRGQIKELRPLNGDRIEPILSPDGTLMFKINLNTGGTVMETQEDLIHVPAMVMEGVKGKSPIDVARDSMGLAMAAEEHGARFFGNGAVPLAVLEHPGQLSDEAAKHLRESWSETFGGVRNSNKTAVLEEGMKLNTVSLTMEQSQFIESRKFQIEEICRWFRMPPHMIGHLDKATFSNIEQQSLEFVIYTMRPWLVRWEKALTVGLLTEVEQQDHFIEFLVDGLLRGDTFTRYQAYKIAREGGWMNIDEIRELENRSPLPDEQGQIFLLTPPGMTNVTDLPASTSPTDDAPEVEDEPVVEEDERAKPITMAYDDFFKMLSPMADELLGRAVRKHEKALRSAITKGNQKHFEAHLEKELGDDYRNAVMPIIQSACSVINRSVEVQVHLDGDIFTAYWNKVVTEGTKWLEGETKQAISETKRSLFETIRNFYVARQPESKNKPTPIQVHVHQQPLDVNVTVEQPAVVHQEITLKRDETGRPTGAKVTKEFA